MRAVIKQLYLSGSDGKRAEKGERVGCETEAHEEGTVTHLAPCLALDDALYVWWQKGRPDHLLQLTHISWRVMRMIL